ncbi:MAG: hypothetical protein ACREOZ_05015, partial [Gloeomargaritales cyanobacterium]
VYTREDAACHKYDEDDAQNGASPKKTRKILPDAVKDYIIEKNRIGITANPIAAAVKNHFRGTIDMETLDSITTKNVQNFIKNHLRGVAPHMSIVMVKDTVTGTEYRATLQEHRGFTFGYDWDDGQPVLGMGSDSDPFILCFSSKVWVCNFFKALQAVAAVDEPVFMLHIDSSFNLNLLGYPVVVLGISDSSRNFHPLGIALVSQTKASILSAIFAKFESFMARLYPTYPWCNKITHCMMDADVAEYNAVTAKFEGAVVLMCFFHVMYNVNKRSRGLPSNRVVQVLKDILKMHVSVSEEEYVRRSRQILAEWRLVPELYAFSQYFEQQWVTNEKFNKYVLIIALT